MNVTLVSCTRCMFFREHVNQGGMGYVPGTSLPAAGSSCIPAEELVSRAGTEYYHKTIKI